MPILDENNDISQEYICSPRDNIQDLSMSLLSHFVYEHTKIELTKEGKEKYAGYCLPNVDGVPLVLPDEYVINDERKYWLIKVSEFDSLKTIIKIFDNEIEASSYSKHTPMYWNFWHISIRWKIANKGLLSDEQVFDDKEKKKLADKIGAKVRSKIASLAVLSLENGVKYRVLNDNCFMN